MKRGKDIDAHDTVIRYNAPVKVWGPRSRECASMFELAQSKLMRTWSVTLLFK